MTLINANYKQQLHILASIVLHYIHHSLAVIS